MCALKVAERGEICVFNKKLNVLLITRNSSLYLLTVNYKQNVLLLEQILELSFRKPFVLNNLMQKCLVIT